MVFKEASVSMPEKTNVYKDKRAWWLSHEAFLTLQELARQKGLQTAAFLEVISRELALEWLSEEQRASIKTEAQRIAADRKNEA
jgi:phage gp46-like protein